MSGETPGATPPADSQDLIPIAPPEPISPDDFAVPPTPAEASSPPGASAGPPPTSTIAAVQPIPFARPDWSPVSGALPPAGVGWFLAVMGLAVVMCFFNLSGGMEFEPIDCWVAQTAREMREAGDWLTPRFSGETRMQKSPGPYWAVMLASLARGTPVDTISARIPSALLAVLLVGVIFWLTRAIAGERAAIFAGFAAASSTLILFWSHRAASDLGLTSLVALSLASFWVAINGKQGPHVRTALWLLGYFAAGLAMMYKMPMPLACVGVPMFAYLLICRRWSVLANWVHLYGFALFCLPWLPWAIAVAIVEPTAWMKWRVEFLDRFTGDLPNVQSQRAWFWYFAYLVPPLVYCLPYSLSLPSAITRVFRRDAAYSRDGMAFAAIWFFSLLAFFTAATGKEDRYLLPALPPLFVLLGVELSRLFDPGRLWNWRRDWLLARLVWVALPLGFIAGAFGVYRWYKDAGQFGLTDARTLWIAYAITAVLFVAGGSLSAWLYARRREHASFAALVTTMCVVWMWVWSEVIPIFDSQKPFTDFARQVRERVPAEFLKPGVIQHAGSQDSRIIWYGDFRFPRVIDQLKLLDMQRGRRSLALEMRLIGEQMVRGLEGSEPYLLAASRGDFVTFLKRGSEELAASGRRMPPVHLWIQSSFGSRDRHYVLFGNRPPPWPEPELTPPANLLTGVWPVAAARGGDSPDQPATRLAPTASAPLRVESDLP
ncbi:MAG: glycosyltransferase family 39 protein [Phycisphaerae bacterium]